MTQLTQRTGNAAKVDLAQPISDAEINALPWDGMRDIVWAMGDFADRGILPELPIGVNERTIYAAQRLCTQNRSLLSRIINGEGVTSEELRPYSEGLIAPRTTRILGVTSFVGRFVAKKAAQLLQPETLRESLGSILGANATSGAIIDRYENPQAQFRTELADALGLIKQTAREHRTSIVRRERNPDPNMTTDSIIVGIEALLGSLLQGEGESKQFPMLKELIKARLDTFDTSRLKPGQRESLRALQTGKLTPKQRIMVQVAGPDIMAGLEEAVRLLRGGQPGYGEESIFTESARKNRPINRYTVGSEFRRFQNKLDTIKYSLPTLLTGLHNTLPSSRQDPLRRVLGRIALWSKTSSQK